MPEILRSLPSLLYNWIDPNIREFNSDQQIKVWLVAMFIGTGISVITILFREAIGLVQLPWLHDVSENVISASKDVPWYIILLAPVIGGAIVGWILENFLPSKRTLGVPDVMEARTMAGRELETKSALWSAAATIVSLGSGASAGREGPMVHLGAALSSSLVKKLRLPAWSHKTLMASGVAAAVSASFNAPIAGVLFAHEIILGHYARRSFVPIVIASVGGTIFSRLWFGDNAAFIIPEYQITSYWEIPAFALLGLVCALVAVLFQFALIGTDFVARRINISVFFLARGL